MKQIKELSGREILSVPRDRPDLLYSSAESAKKEFRVLSMRWHPDHGGDASVFEHARALYYAAVDRASSGVWYADRLTFEAAGGKKYETRYRSHREIGIGDAYVADTAVTYIVSQANSDLVANASMILRSLKFADAKMKSEFSRRLPEKIVDADTSGGRAVVYKKDRGLILLADVVEKKGPLEPVHVAWVLSSLYNMACYLKFCGVSHNDISLDTCFVSPGGHDVALLGGWWYSSSVGEKISALPRRTVRECVELAREKKSDGSSDLQLIKTLGLEALGDPAGTKTATRSRTDPSWCPAPFLNWLKTPPGRDALAEYTAYRDVIDRSWGRPKFHELSLTPDDVYGERP